MIYNVRFNEHTADMQMHVWDAQKSGLFVHALAGMNMIMGLSCQTQTIQEEIVVQATSFENLFVDVLSEILTLQAINHTVYSAISVVKMAENMLNATLHGCIARSGTGVEIKAVTYHNISVYYKENAWHAIVTFDI